LDHLEFCQDTYRGSGGEADLARIEAMLGMAKAQMQDPLGRDLCSGAAQVFESVDDAYHLAVAKTALGITHLFVGEVPMAAELWEQALDIFRRIGNSYWPGQLLQNLAHFRLMDGDWKGALERFRESMEIAREFDYPIVFNLAVAGLAAVAVVLEEPEAAARLFGSVRASLDKLGVSFEPLDQESMNRYLELAKEKMTEQAFQQAFAQGAAWSEQEIWAAALAVGPE
jgi:tetratricopeptide (TPR) repeat protein